MPTGTREFLFLEPPPADERITYGSDPNQFVEFYHPRGPVRGSAILIHGGFWRNQFDRSHMGHLARMLADEGISAANIEYRRVGQEGGGWPNTYDDVRHAVQCAREHVANAHAQQPVLIGYSAGGHLALLLATQYPPYKSVVALAPAAHLARCFEMHLGDDAVVAFLSGTPEQVPHRYEAACPSRHASTVPRLIIHGTADDRVPVEVTHAYISARAPYTEPVRLLEIEGATHFDMVDYRSDVWPLVFEEILFQFPR